MPAHESRLSRWGQFREWFRISLRSECRRDGAIALYFPPGSWYEAHAEEMLRLLVETTGQLENALGLVLPPTDCFVTDPETALALAGSGGMAYERSILIGFPERHMSEFAGTAAHELAHILSHQLGRPASRFLVEGFACYAAQRIGADAMPVGVPSHYHTAWLLSVGVSLPLVELWRRRDYTPELYDLAWSFATFIAQRFGQDHYFAFYGCPEMEPGRRIESTLGVSLEQLEREWHAHARQSHRITATRSDQSRRCPGSLCSRAAWLRKRGLTAPASGPHAAASESTSSLAAPGPRSTTLPVLPLLLPVMHADKYDQCPVADACRWQSGRVLQKLPPVLTAGGLRARIMAEVYPGKLPRR